MKIVAKSAKTLFSLFAEHTKNEAPKAAIIPYDTTWGTRSN